MRLDAGKVYKRQSARDRKHQNAQDKMYEKEEVKQIYFLYCSKFEQ